MKNNTDTRWVVTSKTGLYTGQWFTRKDAIRDHCLAYIWGHETMPATDAEIRAEWKRCRANGDRVVKAKITYPVL